MAPILDQEYISGLFSLAGMNVLVTGATGYLGSVMSLALGKAGANVLVNSRSQSKGERVVFTLESNGLSAEVATFDVMKSDEVNLFFDNYEPRPLHGIVNNAYAGGSGTIEYCNESDYGQSYDCCVVSMHRVMHAALPALRRGVSDQGYASVVNISSMYGLVSPDLRVYDSPSVSNPPFYGAAKAAMIQWTKYAACEFARENIRFNCLSPGPFPNNQVQNDNPELVRRLGTKVPMGRIGMPDELSGALLLLLSQSSSYITGANLSIDGGWTVQ